MSKDNADKFDKLPDNADEEIFREIIEYYGEDTVNLAASMRHPSPQKRVKFRRLYSALSIVCAVVFLTGVAILSSVFINSEKPYSYGNMNSSQNSYVQSGLHSSNDSIGNNSNDSLENSANESNNNLQSNGDFLSSAIPSNVISSEASENISSFMENSFITSSEFSSVMDSSSVKSNASEYFSSRNEYSLPDIPDEGTVTSVHTDTENNSISNPNDNVTTGDVVQVGVGVSLTVLSLAVALVLNRLRAEYE